MRLLRAVLKWYYDRKCMAVVWFGGRIKAVCLIRLHSDPSQFEFPYRHDPAGAICWIELTVSDGALWQAQTAAVFAKLWKGVSTWKGFFMWQRTIGLNDKGPIRAYTFHQFQRILLALAFKENSYGR